MSASVLTRVPTYPFLVTNENYLGEVKAVSYGTAIIPLLHFDLCLAPSSPVKQDTAHGRSNFDSPSNSSSLPTASCRFPAVMGSYLPFPGCHVRLCEHSGPYTQHSSFCWGSDEYGRLETAVQSRLSETL